jgi:hypothetical protein
VRLAGGVYRPLVLVHRVGVGELAVALRTLDHDALVEHADMFAQLGPEISTKIPIQQLIGKT